MPSVNDFGQSLGLPNQGGLFGRNQADTSWVELAKVTTGNQLEWVQAPRVRRVDFTRQADPILVADAGGGAATGVAGDINLMVMPNLAWNYHIKGTQTILGPALTTTGLNISMDQTDDDGVELRPSILGKSDFRFVVGTDKAFFFEVKLKIADASGTDDLRIGFRKFEADQANVDDYDEMACIGIGASLNIEIETILNAAATTTTDTTNNSADGETRVFRVNVSAAGVVTYLLDGVAPTTTAAFTFDNAEVVIPFIFFLHSADVAGDVEIIHLECGHQTST